ncbi:MAG: hypothetical protein Q8Q60_03495 [Candidatus Chromulinivorax sp.]|nr:hypothetical protein [Candidatus Chromulinivorax sp.]
MQVNAHKIFMVILIAMNFQPCMPTDKRHISKIPPTAQPTQATTQQEENPTPAFIKKYRNDNCIGKLCCSSNPEHQVHLMLSMRGSRYYACIMCQVRPVDVYNEASFKWDGDNLDRCQSCINRMTGPTRPITLGTLVCCSMMWRHYYLKPNHPEVLDWDQNHDIDWENRKIIPKPPVSEQMKRD